jgi:hypothetical protein
VNTIYQIPDPLANLYFPIIVLANLLNGVFLNLHFILVHGFVAPDCREAAEACRHLLLENWPRGDQHIYAISQDVVNVMRENLTNLSRIAFLDIRPAVANEIAFCVSYLTSASGMRNRLNLTDELVDGLRSAARRVTESWDLRGALLGALGAAHALEVSLKTRPDFESGPFASPVTQVMDYCSDCLNVLSFQSDLILCGNCLAVVGRVFGCDFPERRYDFPERTFTNPEVPEIVAAVDRFAVTYGALDDRLPPLLVSLHDKLMELSSLDVARHLGELKANLGTLNENLGAELEAVEGDLAELQASDLDELLANCQRNLDEEREQERAVIRQLDEEIAQLQADLSMSEAGISAFLSDVEVDDPALGPPPLLRKTILGFSADLERLFGDADAERKEAAQDSARHLFLLERENAKLRRDIQRKKIQKLIGDAVREPGRERERDERSTDQRIDALLVRFGEGAEDRAMQELVSPALDVIGRARGSVKPSQEEMDLVDRAVYSLVESNRTKRELSIELEKELEQAVAGVNAKRMALSDVLEIEGDAQRTEFLRGLRLDGGVAADRLRADTEHRV